MATTIPAKRAGEFELPVLGLGTWQMGGRYERDPGSDDARDVAAIRAALELGIRHLDTAESYAAGHAEELVGEAIRGFNRGELVLTTKVSSEHLRYDDVLRAAEGSLKRLGVDYLDLYLIHGPNPQVPLTETMRAMDELTDRRLVRHLGVSNFDSALLAEAQRWAQYRIVSNQIHYSLTARAFEENGTLPYCRDHDVIVTAYRPLGKGDLTLHGKPLVDELAVKYGKTPAQIALNWVIGKPNVVALFKTSNIRHLEENLGALGWALEPEDAARLDSEFPRGETMYVPAR
jgi:diketogulonate reductase-like aldo/keto reductase